MTIKQAIKNSALDKHLIELILQEELGLNASQLFLYQEKKIGGFKAQRIKKIEKRVSSGYPIQYIYKKANFNGLDFFVNKNVLIPRPETEILIGKANDFILKNKLKRVIDIGTGSGAIAISIAKNNPDVDIEAVDISNKALKVAIGNCKKHKAKIKFYQSDLLNRSKGRYDLILANLPYLDKDETSRLVAEPRLALYGGQSGMYLIKKLIIDLPNFLTEQGIAIFEIGHDQKNAVQSVCDSLGLKTVFAKDLNNYDRFAIIGKDID